MMEELNTAAETLEKILREQTHLAGRLYNCICNKEHALVEEKLTALKKAVENEEDLVQDLSDKEKTRQDEVQNLIAMLAIPEKNPSLRDLTAKMGDKDLTERLNHAGTRLADIVLRVHEKNEEIRALLNLKSAYTETMLQLMTGKSESMDHSYGAHGEILELNDPGPGIYEVLI